MIKIKDMKGTWKFIYNGFGSSAKHDGRLERDLIIAVHIGLNRQCFSCLTHLTECQTGSDTDGCGNKWNRFVGRFEISRPGMSRKRQELETSTIYRYICYVYICIYARLVRSCRPSIGNPRT